MKLKILNKNEIEIAANAIKDGDLVAFPTETVYGLGADALNPDAVEKIFKVKGRPIDNPLIIHVNNLEMANKIAHITENAKILLSKFSPGPLTIILKKKEVVPAITCANLDTVAVRIPNNKIALELIEKANTPIAAPSANLSGKPSPTNIQHIIDDLGDKINYAIEGETTIGVESTVLDLTEKKPKILRYGGITYEDLKKVIDIELIEINKQGKKIIKTVKSPGMKYTHYSPDAPLIMATGNIEEITGKINDLIKEYTEKGEKNENVGIIITEETKDKYPANIKKIVLGSRSDLKTISKNLFNSLREMDKNGVSIIFIEGFEKKGLGLAIMDRLEKASSKII
ncbi:L-threonylcarbamoyladenylate synthase [Methanococcus aeolicus]|uniref:L-threonylcarbamoyladenylate synthase n=1 Tax=Methanococcus aeolicus TaxID=42879 RepID=UPI0021C5CB80|nr:L-threonylcarbamoyladenylate synthase [Methanococcus aeolicus]UXM85036.1 L-threonylcarbamoyladenylate synthase [Methanococcus aeolicus]